MKRLLVIVCMLLGPLSAGSAWAATYTFRSDTYAWESASTAITWNRTCTGFPGDDDQATITFTGGFTFRFAGTAYGSVRVLANGALQFGADTGFMRQFVNTALPAGAAAAYGAGCAGAATERTILAYWADLNPSASGSGGVTWQQKGTAPNRYVVVSWNEVYQYQTTTPYTFQVILYENGEFKYQYGNANASGANATIGVQVSATDTTMYAYNSGYNANGTAIRWFVPDGRDTRVAEFRFDEYGYTGAIGEVRDASGNARHGVRVGSAASSANGYVCRGLDVPADTTTASHGVDTLLDLIGAVGANGSVDLWYRSNVAWSGSSAMLFDATRSSSRPFYLMRNSSGALVFGVSDSAGTRVTATSAALGVGAGTWTHIAVTWRLANGTNQSTLRIYVNGTLRASASGTTNGNLDASLGTLFVGDNRSTTLASGTTGNAANGRIDEVRVANYELTTFAIAASMAANHACPPPLDHYELSLATSSLACLPSVVTVTACTDSSSPCTNPATSLVGQTAVLNASGGSLAASTVVFDATGVARTTLSHPAATEGAAVSVTLSGEQTAAPSPRRCCPDGATCTVADRCTTSFATAGFVVAAAADGTATTIPAQTAGTTSASHVLRAVKTNTNTRSCEAALVGPTTVDWALQCLDPSTCSAGNRMTVTGTAAAPVASNPSSGVTTSTPVAMTFDANGNAPFRFTYADVGQVRLRVNKDVNGAPLVGWTNAFVTRPAGFTIGGIRQTASPNLANPGASSATGPRFVRAGEAFTATVTAVASNGAATPNFGREATPQGVAITHALVQPAGGVAGALSNGAVAGASFSAGAAFVSTLSFGEVGIVRLTPNLASGSYLGAGHVTGTTSGDVGRFVPVRFLLSGSTLTHRAQAACAPASSFTYLGENFTLGFTLEAQNLVGAATRNYQGSFAKLDLAAPSVFALAGRDGTTVFDTGGGRLALGTSSGAWSNGAAAGITLVANAARAASPDGPFAAAFGVAPVDSDGVALASFDMASSSGGANDRATVAAVPLRFGRLKLGNAIGAQGRALALPLVAQHWNGSAFDTNTLDSCTVVPASAVSFGNLRRTLTAADLVVTSAAAVSAGIGRVSLAAPGGGRHGSVDVASSLGSVAADTSCLAPWTPARAATTGAGLAYLRGAWCGSTHDKDASARASWGLWGGSDDKLYQREDY